MHTVTKFITSLVPINRVLVVCGDGLISGESEIFHRGGQGETITDMGWQYIDTRNICFRYYDCYCCCFCSFIAFIVS